MPASPSPAIPASSPSRATLTVWYDGACPLCLREIRVMRRLDRRGAIRFLDLTDGAVACPRERSLMLERLHCEERGQMLSGAAAFAALWRAIPVLRPLGELARIPGVLRLLERVYCRFLLVRPLLQRLLR